MKKKLPIGIENFKEFQSENFYYVDKTMFIAELLQNWGKVNLFTRPRRFGKSLNMNMLKTFFEIGCDQTAFDGLKITAEHELCDEFMGKFPVISITLKGVEGLSYDEAFRALRHVIGMESRRFQFLLESEHLTDEEKDIYQSLIAMRGGTRTIDSDLLATSLQDLSVLLEKHYSRKVILLIDEYDVPLDKAFQQGYYNEMVTLLRKLFGNALKTNDSLHFAVLSGCLRISKESIFTGLNNLNVMTITDTYFSTCFGFTDEEVRDLLSYYGLDETLDTVRDWYDGYQFGTTFLYCPWDVIKYVQALLKNKNAMPENYWVNTSGNAMVRRFIDKADQQTRDEIEQLIAGEQVVKEIRQDLTYNELDTSINNLWSVLLATGYLTVREQLSAKKYCLSIPNAEIRDLFFSQIKEWFREKTAKEPNKLDAFCTAVLTGNEENVQIMLTDYLKQTISIRDTNTKKNRKETLPSGKATTKVSKTQKPSVCFYHGILLGLLSYRSDWSVKSNEESGDGYSDILIRDIPTDTGIVIEVKYAEQGKFDSVCEEALAQIESTNYTEALHDDGMEKIIKYGIAFYKKRCRVVRGK